MRENLVEVVNRTEEEIQWYLEDVSIKDFISDVNDLAKTNTDKEFIKKAIKSLQELL